MTYWAVFNPAGVMNWSTVTPFADLSRHRALGPKERRPWRYFYNRGYRCKRIKVEVME